MNVSPVVAGLRKQYPGYDDIPDEDFVQSIHDAHYSDMPEEDFYKAMDDAYAPPQVMDHKASWGENVIRAMTDAAKTMPREMWNDFTGMGSGMGKGFGAHALERVPVPSETPAELRARGYTPAQVQNVLRGNASIRETQATELQNAAESATKSTARGAAFMATLPIAAETAVGRKLGLHAIKNAWLRHAAVGALAVGTYEGARTGLEEGSLEHVPQAAAQGGITGALAGPVLGRAAEAVGAVLRVPQQVVAGYHEASQRLAAQMNAAGMARSTSFVERWATRFNADNIRNFPDIHNALANGKITPQQAAQQLIDAVRSDKPGGFLDAGVLSDPQTLATLEDTIAKKLGKWWLAQPGVRNNMRNLPRPVQPVADVSGNQMLNTAAPEPNTIGNVATATADDLSTGASAMPTMAVEPPPLETGSAGTPFIMEPTAPPMPPEGLQLTGVAPAEAASASFNTPQPLGKPLGLEPTQSPALEPSAVELPPAPQAPLSGPLGGFEPVGQTARQAETPLVLEPQGRTLDAPSVPGITGNTIQPVRPGSVVADMAQPGAGKWRPFLDSIGPTAQDDINMAVSQDLTPVAEDLRLPPPPPGNGKWHPVTTFADANIAAAKARLAKRGVRLNAFIDPADVADVAIIGANYMLKGVTEFAAWSEQMVREFGDTVKPHLQRLYGEAKAAFDNRRPVGNDRVRQTSADYLAGIGLGPGKVSEYHPSSPALGARIAEAYDAMPPMPKEGTPEFQKAHNAYRALVQEVEEQYQHMLDSGVTVEFTDADPYANSAEMMADLRDNWRLRVFKTPDNESFHPFLTPAQNDKLRAVHDFFGHAKEGYEFGPRGEDNAWRVHASMFSDDAIPAMTTETRGQNSWVNYAPANSALPQGKRPFAAQKFGLLPEWAYKDIIQLRKRDAAGLTAGVALAKNENSGNVAEVAERVTQGVRRATNPKTQLARALADGTSGIPEWHTMNPGSVNWYDSSIKSMMQKTEQELPSLRDNPTKQGIFKVLLAISSTANKPTMNYDYALRMFEGYEKTGRMPMFGRTGQELGLFGRPQATRFNALIKHYHGDEAALLDYLTSKPNGGTYRAINEFGPKIGRFFLNLYGVHDEVTVDRWMVRWWNRVNGNRTIEDVPNKGTRDQIAQAITTLADKFSLKPDEVQAILWDREKRMWRQAGLRDPGEMNFDQAADVVLANRQKTVGRAADVFNRPVQEDLFSPSAEPVEVPASPVAAAAQEEGSQLLAFMHKNYKGMNPAKAESSVRGRPYWLGPDGTLFDVPHHEEASSRAMKSARVGSKKVGYKGTYRWDNHGMLQRGFIRVQMQPNSVNVETVRNATSSQRAVIAKLARGRDGFIGVVSNNEGNGAQHAETWADMRRLMDKEGGQ